MDIQTEIRATAMRFLAVREYSTTELTRKLTQKGHDAALVKKVLGQLEQEKLLSDERFLDSFISSRREKGQGPMRIQRDLEPHEIENMLIETYLDVQDPHWLNVAKQVREKKFGADLPGEYKEKMRQARFLEYRGFTHGQIFTILQAEEEH